MITIEKIMSKPIFMAKEDLTVKEVVKIMIEKKIGSLIIVNDKEIVGIITERDLVKRVLYGGLDKEKTKAKDIMSHPILEMDKHLPLNEAALAMSNSHIQHIVVTDEEGPVGMLSSRDIAYYATTS